VLHLRTWIPAELDQFFSGWCDGHHLEQLAVPGFRRVRRFSLVRSAADEPARFLTIYDLDRLDVLESEGYAEYRRSSTGLPEVLQGRLRAARSDSWLVAGVPPVAGMVAGGMGLAHLFVPAGPDLAPWFAEHGPAVVDAVGATTARLLRSTTGEQIIVAELEDAPTATGRDDPLMTLPLPDLVGPGDAGPDREPGDAVGWGRYRLDYLATPDGAHVFHS